MTAFLNTYDRDRRSFPLEQRARFGSVQIPEGGLTLCGREWNVPRLRYGYHRVYYVKSGDVLYTDERRTVRLQSGHLYILPSQTVRYGLEHDPEHPLYVLWCHMEVLPDFLNDMIDLEIPGDDELAPLIAQWEHFVSLPQPGNEVYHVLMLILCRLERQGRLEFADLPFHGIEHFIYEHIGEDLTVESLAKRFGYTRSHFTRIFKQRIKLSPGEYLRVVRMSRASNLLRSGWTIAEVCENLGYTDRKVFSRAFSAYHGVSPSLYIRKHKMQPL